MKIKAFKDWSFAQVLFAAAIWTLVRLIPYFLVDDFLFDFALHHQYKGGLPLVLLVLATPLLWILEALGWIYLLVVLIHLNGLARWLFGMVLLPLLYGYHLFLICSWLVFLRTGFFLGVDSLSLVEYFSEASDVLVATSASDLFAMAAALLLACFPVVLYYTLARRACASLSNLARASLCAGCVLVAILVPPRLFSPLLPKQQKLLESLAYNFMAPELSAIWAPAWFGWPAAEFEVVPLSLPTQYSLDTYLEAAPQQLQRKNFILIMIEALRADVLQAYGGTQNVMPFLDSLSEESLVFERAYTQAPETGYSQTTIMSGLYPLKYPKRDVGRDLNYPMLRIYDLLDRLGYRTGYFTEEWGPTVRQNRSKKLDRYFKPLALSKKEILQYVPAEKAHFDRLGFPTFATIDRANIRAMTDWIIREEQQPYFAASYLYASHYPFDVPEEQYRVFNPSSLQGKELTGVSFLDYPVEYSEIMKNRYLNCLRFIDAQLEQMFGDLEQAGKLENTVVIITADHGELFHEHNLVNHAGYMYEEVMHVPLLVAGSDIPQAPTDRVVGHVDIAPTVLDILGLPPHDAYQGTSLLHAGDSPDTPRPIFASVQFAVQEDCVWLQSWKYCFNTREQRGRLFHLTTDPGEQNNLAIQRPDVAAALADVLRTFKNRQFTFYSPDQPYRDRYFPPRHDMVVEAALLDDFSGLN